MSLPSVIEAPPQILQPLSKLLRRSLEQEDAVSKGGRVFSSKIIGDIKDRCPEGDSAAAFDKLMIDKFIVLNEEKCQYAYQLVNVVGATNIVETGTSFGVCTQRR